MPNVLGLSKQHTGSYQAGWVCYAGLAVVTLAMLRIVARSWTRTWVGTGGRAIAASRSSSEGPIVGGGYVAAD